MIEKFVKTNMNIKSMIEYPKEGILSKQVFKTDKIDVGLFCMAKGAGMSEHTSTKQGTVELLEGKMNFILNKKNFIMGAGDILFMKNNELHSLKAKERTSFLLTLS